MICSPDQALVRGRGALFIMLLGQGIPMDCPGPARMRLALPPGQAANATAPDATEDRVCSAGSGEAELTLHGLDGWELGSRSLPLLRLLARDKCWVCGGVPQPLM